MSSYITSGTEEYETQYEVTITNVHNEWLYQVWADSEVEAIGVAKGWASREGWNYAGTINVRELS